MDKLKLDYFYGSQGEQFAFYQIPQALFTYEVFRPLSDSAKILYGILLNRNTLSMRNNWIDNDSKVAFIYFTIEEVMETLGCGRDKAVKTMAELDKIGLIEKKRQGQGKATKIFVKNFASLADFLKSEKPTSRSLVSRFQEVGKTECSNNELNNNDFINNQSINPTLHHQN